MSANKNDDMMLRLSLNQMESVKGREGLQGIEAENAISQVKIAAGGELAEEERKVLGSRRLAKAMGVQKEARLAKNEKVAFDNMLNSLQSIFGRDGFKGEEAEKTLKEIREVNTMASAEENMDKKLLGSRRVYKFVRAATKTVTRPVRRKNHNGETFDSSAGHR